MNRRRTAGLSGRSRLLIGAALLAFPVIGLAVVLTQDDESDTTGAPHNPRFSSGRVHGSQLRVRPFWELLYRHGAEWVFSGDDHNYQRFAPQTPTGKLDRKRGIRQFVVGTGGAQHYRVGKPLAHTEVQNSGAFGVLELTLHDGSYEWRFVPQPGRAFKDSGSANCSS